MWRLQLVAKRHIQTALAVANFYWCIILLSPAVQDTMTPRATSVIIIAIIRTLINLICSLNASLACLPKLKEERKERLLNIQQTAALAGVILADDPVRLPACPPTKTPSPPC